MEGVVLTTEDLAPEGLEVETAVLSAEVLPEETPPDACTRLAVLLSELLLRLKVLLEPIPPLSDELLPNTRSEPVRCLEPYHTSFL